MPAPANSRAREYLKHPSFRKRGKGHRGEGLFLSTEGKKSAMGKEDI